MCAQRKRRPIATLKDAIQSFLQQSGLSRLAVQDQLGRAWTEALGPQIASHTRISRTIRRGVLNVEVDSSALLAELSGFRKPEILAVLRERFKREYIEDIRFKLGSFTEEKRTT